MFVDIQRLKQYKILLIGDSCLDYYHYGTIERYATEERPYKKVPILKVKETKIKQGMAGNVRENLFSIGIEPAFITNDVKIKKERFISNKKELIDQILRVDVNDCVKRIKKTTLKKLINDKTYDAVVISDYDKGYLKHPDICMLLSKITCPVFVDSKKTDLSCFENCIIKINNHEKRNVDQFPKKCELIITLGKDGAIWNDKKYTAGYSKEVIDICGAGDTFLVGLLIAYMQTKDIDCAIKYANKLAALSLNTVGNYIVNKDDLKKINL